MNVLQTGIYKSVRTGLFQISFSHKCCKSVNTVFFKISSRHKCCQIDDNHACFHFKIQSTLADEHVNIEFANTCGNNLFKKDLHKFSWHWLLESRCKGRLANAMTDLSEMK